MTVTDRSDLRPCGWVSAASERKNEMGHFRTQGKTATVDKRSIQWPKSAIVKGQSLYHFDPQRGRCLIALLVTGLVIGGIALGWYGHKAIVRIQVWGMNMNEQDRILQIVTNAEGCADYQMPYQQAEGNSHDGRAFENAHLPFGVATSK